MLQIEGLSKQFYMVNALNQVNLTIPPGEVLGVLGPNGAGKTTLFRILTGLLMPDSGRIVPISGRWPSIGYKPERLAFPDGMRVQRYLEMMAAMSNVGRSVRRQRARHCLRMVGLEDAGEKQLGSCSKGMRQRIGLAQTLLGNPELLILDEPTDGLDPSGQAEIQSVIKRLRDDGITIVISSHQLGEVTQICSELAILRAGRLIYRNTMAEALVDRPQAVIFVDRPLDSIRPLLESLHPRIEVGSDQVGLRGDAAGLRRQVLSLLLASGYDIVQIDRKQATLSEIYKEVTRS